MSFPSGITTRTTQLAWTVTLVTLAIFVVFIIPEQKWSLQQGLASKAKGVAVALQSDIAGATASEDYTPVVEHAMDVIAGDPELEFLLITKADGYTIAVDRNGWTVIPKIDEQWLPAERVAQGTIADVPLFHRRVYRYSDPFSYNGLEWGWVHVGLNLDWYDSSVRTVYLRTSLLASSCIVLALVASMLFARRFVRPILSLRTAVERVASGDFSARAPVGSQDEIEQLAVTFNNMADEVLHRNRIMEAVRYTAQSLQSSDDWIPVMEVAAAKLGMAANVSRVIVIENCSNGEKVFPQVRMEWAAPGIGHYGASWLHHSTEELNFGLRMKSLSGGQLLIEHATAFRDAPIPGAEPQAQSAIVAPVMTGNLWGALVIHDCWCDRNWLDVELDSVRAIADTLSAFLQRQRAQQELILARDQLEQHVIERTRELSEQIQARDRANARLQEAQQQLMELSRQSGMAEVATGVLHNVGNVLNSINVSAGLVADRVRASRVVQLRELTRLLKEHEDGLGKFLEGDERGRRVLPYMAGLSEHLLHERDGLGAEMQTLMERVNHVKDIIATQQDFARGYGVLEKIRAESLVADALRIVHNSFVHHDVQIVQHFAAVPAITTDRNKVLQILLNLLHNAKDAVRSGGRTPRRVDIHLYQPDAEHVRFEIADNGIGIAPENLDRIFSHGFTTKKDGHGFGLHSGALAADLLGGSLRVKSDGLGSGASFMLDLPLHPGSGKTLENV